MFKGNLKIVVLGLKRLESTEYTVLITHIGVWVKTKINNLYPRCKFNISDVLNLIGWLNKQL